jgi:hypothetical protein
MKPNSQASWEHEFAFDPEFYQESYLTEKDEPEDALDHYLREGAASGNYSSASDYIAKNLSKPYSEHADSIIRAFDWKAYRSRNKDIRRLSPLDATYHFVRHGLTEWRHFNSASKLLDRRFAFLDQVDEAWHLTTPLQAVVHCYHYDVLCKLLPYLRAIARLGGRVCILNSNSNLLDSVISEYLSSLNTGAAKHTAHRVPNHGEDWSSFHWAYSQGLFDGRGVTFKLQTKKSANLGIDGGLAWIDEALQPLCGSYQAIKNALKTTAKHEHSCMASQLVLRYGYGANPSLISEYIHRLGIPIPKTTNLFWRLENGIAVKSGKTGHPVAHPNLTEPYQCQPDSTVTPSVVVDAKTREELLRLDDDVQDEPQLHSTLNYAPLSGHEVIDYAWPFAAGSMFAATNKTIRSFYEQIGSIDYSEEQAGGNEHCGRFIGHALERVFFYYAHSRNWPLEFN